MKKLILISTLFFSFNLFAVDSFPLPVGTLIPFTGPACPMGTILADGSLKTKDLYPRLFALYGNIYGSQNASQFRIPSFQGYTLRGLDPSATIDVNASTRTAQNAGGSTGNAVGTIQQDAFQGHAHGYLDNQSGSGSPGGAGVSGDRALITYSIVTDGTNGTPRVSSETRMKNITVLFCIKY